MKPRALVSQTRMPEFDRDRGSQRIDLFIGWLLAEGWSVTFVSRDSNADPRHAHRLRQLGVATYAGYDELGDLLDSAAFDLALLAFWEPASEALPELRARSPHTRVIVDSIDLHFLREARRSFGAGADLEDGFGSQVVGELNAYRGADAVLAVSAKEAGLLADFLGPERVFDIPLAEPILRSSLPFEERTGIFFVGNFRHLPNGEAVEYLCRDILPRLDPELLAEHPLSVVGSHLDDKVVVHGRGMPSARMVGWVPSILPYLERARVCAVPLLHGAGVKGKIVESLMAGTPVVTTPIGAEGLDLQNGEHAIIAASATDLAAGLSELLTDAHQWRRLADAGHELAARAHDPEAIRERFLEVLERVRAMPPLEAVAGTSTVGRAHRRELAYRAAVESATTTLEQITEPGSTVLVVSRGDDRLVALDGRRGKHFPQADDGRWAGYHPADSASAINHLEAMRDRRARYLAFPSASFWWLHHYADLTAHLEANYRRIHSGEHLLVFDVGGRATRASDLASGNGRRETVLILGTYSADRKDPPADLVAEFDRSDRFAITQSWRRAGDVEPEDGDADWVVKVSDAAVLPEGFVDRFLTAAERLGRLGVVRAQPAHNGDPSDGPPVCQCHRGVLAREIAGATPLPVLALRQGADPAGPVALIDSVPVGLIDPIAPLDDPCEYSDMLDAFVGPAETPRRAVERSQAAPAPVISVLISTYDRPELLGACLESLCEQTLPATDFEVVVVDDGSPGAHTSDVLETFAARLPLTWLRIEHAGRSTAKNLALLLARGDQVLFFDDDDRAAPELLEEHARVHELNPQERIAVLGHTDWAPELEITPLMHYLTDVDKMLFAYGNIGEDRRLDWRGFWEGRVSSKRSLHLRHGLHDQRLAYSIDVELGWRLMPHGLEVVYNPAALSWMARPIDFDAFCRRQEAKGRAQATIARLHDDEQIRAYTQIEGAAERWRAARPAIAREEAAVRDLERDLAGDRTAAPEDREAREQELYRLYRSIFRAYNAKGMVDETGSGAPESKGVPVTNGRPADLGTVEAPADGAPALTVTMPVWSRTPELAEIAARTIDRVWEVARIPTEVVVIDNGSPVRAELRARVRRFEENRGVAPGWNAGVELARAPVVAVLNSDCKVEPGWDEALYEAATSGRRIAFPYTDHCDGRGFRRPDQAGTAGWCFMLTTELYREIGPFDENFAPAYCEDTDYWHRAWELGVGLSPVPQAHVVHARRTSVTDADHSDWLLTSHRYYYGWKHGVEPMAAPPYYNREVVEYHAAQPSPRSATTT